MSAAPHGLPPLDLPAALGESEPTLRAILDASLDAFILIDAIGIIRLWNRAAVAMFGWTEAAAVGQRLSETIIPERYREQHELGLVRYRATGEGKLINRRVEITARHRDGREFLVELTVAPIGHSGAPRFGAFLRDLSERQEMEEQLKFQSIILRNVRDSIVVADLEGRVQFWNRGAEALFGYSKEEMLGQSVAILYTEPDGGVRLAEDRARILQGEDASGEWLRGRKDGSTVWIDSKRVVLRDGEGRAIGILGVARDVSERKRVSEELLASHEQLRELARRLRSVREQERTVMARQIHDELGQALSALHLDVAWLRARLANADVVLEEKARSMAVLIETSIGQVRALATELRPAVLDSLGLLAAIEWETQQFTRRTEIPCTLELPPDPPAVDADRSTDVFRVLQEALTNVARHARAHHVTVSLELRRGALHLRVRDDGRGITAAEIASPQALGLVGMRERALLWDGVVEWRADDAGGTVVDLRLPLAPGGRNP
ncbi:MAG TPA: PAS domain-containing sensor histidine kinase [Gemmatimonadales bacterium]|jgi:PAS domain S-box-containing protein|nr:PAS domain-containing sensor histidine kinase [Gemmatimonadales bacterium]